MVSSRHAHCRAAYEEQPRNTMVSYLAPPLLNLNPNACDTRVPQNVGENRFGNWLANARDWNVSRNRYWGTPIPLWVSDDMEEVNTVLAKGRTSSRLNPDCQVVCVGSVEELERLSGVKGITDIHPDKINHITIPSQKGKGTLKRVEEVFDCWFESGRYVHLDGVVPAHPSQH
jgi:isoleucyl-tRNA synthetase